MYDTRVTTSSKPDLTFLKWITGVLQIYSRHYRNVLESQYQSGSYRTIIKLTCLTKSYIVVEIIPTEKKP